MYINTYVYSNIPTHTYVRFPVGIPLGMRFQCYKQTLIQPTTHALKPWLADIKGRRYSFAMPTVATTTIITMKITTNGRQIADDWEESRQVNGS